MDIASYVSGGVGVVANGIVLVILGTRKSKTSSKLYFMHQAGIDFCASLMLITGYIGVQPDYSKTGGLFMCRFWISRFLMWSFLISSTYNLVLTSLDRYFLIVHPIWHKKTMTKTKFHIMFVFGWLSGFIWKVPTVVPTTGLIDGECVSVAIWPSTALQRGVGCLGIVLEYFIPLGLLIFSYTRILMVLKKRNTAVTGASHATSKGQQNVVKTLILVGFAFVVCWTPNQMLFFQFNLGGPLDFSGYMYYTSVILVFINSCINPLVCLLTYQQCRQTVSRMFKRNQVNPVHEITTSS